MNNTLLIIAGIVILIVYLVYTAKRNKELNEKGIEADAIVSKIDEDEIENKDGTYETKYTYYVKYTLLNGQEVEAKLGNAPESIKKGQQVRIKYLEDKPRYVLYVKK